MSLLICSTCLSLLNNFLLLLISYLWMFLSTFASISMNVGPNLYEIASNCRSRWRTESLAFALRTSGSWPNIRTKDQFIKEDKMFCSSIKQHVWAQIVMMYLRNKNSTAALSEKLVFIDIINILIVT